MSTKSEIEGWNQERFLDVLRRRGYTTQTKAGRPSAGVRATGPAIAELLGINVGTANKLLSGQHKPSLVVVARAAKALAVSADWLMNLSEIEVRL